MCRQCSNGGKILSYVPHTQMSIAAAGKQKARVGAVSHRKHGIVVCLRQGAPDLQTVGIEQVDVEIAGADGEGRTSRGIGFYLARLVIEHHGGSIRATESTIGGARFEISLPREVER